MEVIQPIETMWKFYNRNFMFRLLQDRTLEFLYWNIYRSFSGFLRLRIGFRREGRRLKRQDLIWSIGGTCGIFGDSKRCVNICMSHGLVDNPSRFSANQPLRYTIVETNFSTMYNLLEKRLMSWDRMTIIKSGYRYAVKAFFLLFAEKYC
jgi:hypothetical protein